MTNYQAIKQMDIHALEAFWDQALLTGLNNGLYASRLGGEEESSVLDENPYDIKWLSEEAEESIAQALSDQDHDYMPNALARAIFRNTGIDTDN